jgi:SAM-dependent methyltransferase
VPAHLYKDLAEWWPLLSPPGDYAQEAVLYGDLLEEAVTGPCRTLMELGSGGGNNASHLGGRFELTLVDRSPEMLAVSKKLNPDCEHLEGDMRTLQMGRQFDAVLIHDAIMHVTSESDLAQVFATAFAHCRPGGAALIAPDHVRETFRPETDHGGTDGPDGRSLRYLEWNWDPDPTDTTYRVEWALMLRETENAPVRVVQDRCEMGLFPRDLWMELLHGAGFEPRCEQQRLFVARRSA